MVLAAELVHDRVEHAGNDESHVDADLPGQLFVAVRADVHEGLEQFDPGNGDDRADQLHLQVGEADMAHPVRAVLVVAGVDLRDEVLVAGEDDDDQQVGDHHDVDQRQDADDDVAAVGAEDLRRELEELLDELDQQDAEEERGH
ncbi:hypothetical protein SDC9_170132 [bioreactor metagenome]|uniref:Uncharacterized protein n=1 Tax=bioreactor metagenome TaxID=1076179 RepID=A0A645GAD0_9ZZZZ